MPAGAKFCPYCGGNSSYVVRRHHLFPKTMVRGKYIVGNVAAEDKDVIVYRGLDTASDTKVLVREYFPQDSVSRDNTASSEVTAKEGADPTSGKETFESAAKQARGVIEVFSENGTVYAVMQDETADAENGNAASAPQAGSAQVSRAPAQGKTQGASKKAPSAKNQPDSRRIALFAIIGILIAIIFMFGFMIARSAQSSRKGESSDSKNTSSERPEFLDHLITASIRPDAQAEGLTLDSSGGASAQAAEEVAEDGYAQEDAQEDAPAEQELRDEDYVTLEEFLSSRNWADLGTEHEYSYYADKFLTYSIMNLDSDVDSELLLIGVASNLELVFEVYEMDGDHLVGSTSKYASVGSDMDSSLASINSNDDDGKMRIFYYDKGSGSSPMIFIEKKRTTKGKRLEFASYRYDGSNINCNIACSSSSKSDDSSVRTLVDAAENLGLDDSNWGAVFNQNGKKCISSFLSGGRKGPILIFIPKYHGVKIDGGDYSMR